MRCSYPAGYLWRAGLKWISLLIGVLVLADDKCASDSHAVSDRLASNRAANALLRIAETEKRIAWLGEYRIFSVPHVKDGALSGVYWYNLPAIEYELRVQKSWWEEGERGAIERCEKLHEQMMNSTNFRADNKKEEMRKIPFSFKVVTLSEVSTTNNVLSPRELAFDYIWRGKVWHGCLQGEFDPKIDFKHVATENVPLPDRHGLRKCLVCVSVEVQPASVKRGERVFATLMLTNCANEDIYIPSFFERDPIELVVVDDQKAEVFPVGSCFVDGILPNSEVSKRGWFLKAGQSETRVVSWRIVGEGYGNRIDLPPGKYRVSLLGLDFYGFPTCCRSASLSVR